MDTSSGHGDASRGTAATAGAPYSDVGQRPVASEGDSQGFPNFFSPDESDPSASTTGPVAAERLMDDFQSLREAFALLVAARFDQIKLSLRRAFLWVVLAAVGVFALVAFAVTACAMLVVGIAGGIAELAGGRLWVGQLTTGAALIIVGAATLWLLVRAWQEQSRRKVLKRYGKNNQ
jgi:hypothetical protein